MVMAVVLVWRPGADGRAQAPSRNGAMQEAAAAPGRARQRRRGLPIAGAAGSSCRWTDAVACPTPRCCWTSTCWSPRCLRPACTSFSGPGGMRSSATPPTILLGAHGAGLLGGLTCPAMEARLGRWRRWWRRRGRCLAGLRCGCRRVYLAMLTLAFADPGPSPTSGTSFTGQQRPHSRRLACGLARADGAVTTGWRWPWWRLACGGCGACSSRPGLCAARRARLGAARRCHWHRRQARRVAFVMAGRRGWQGRCMPP